MKDSVYMFFTFLERAKELIIEDFMEFRNYFRNKAQKPFPILFLHFLFYLCFFIFICQSSIVCLGLINKTEKKGKINRKIQQVLEGK